jgi:hypothetical protein
MTAPTFIVVERSLWFCNTVLSAVLVFKLYFSKLAATYRFFFAAIALNIVRTIVIWRIDISSNAYFNFWRATEPITWLLNTLVVLELCSLIFREYRGIQVLGRRTIYGSLAAAVLISLIILAPTWRRSNQPMLSFQRFLMVERGVDSALVILLFLLLVFLALLPIPLSRNVVIHSVLYAMYFLSGSIGIFIANGTSTEARLVISTCLMGVSFLCLGSWNVLLRRAGETKIAVMPKPLPAAYEEKLVEQLSSINATLLRASSKVESARLVSK